MNAKDKVEKAISLLNDDPSLQYKNYHWNNQYFTHDEMFLEKEKLDRIFQANVLHQNYSLELRYLRDRCKLVIMICKKGLFKYYFTMNGIKIPSL